MSTTVSTTPSSYPAPLRPNQPRTSVNIGLWILRIIIGCLFIFSGVVKANDPMGLSNKMNEFFEVWGMHSMQQYSLGLSVMMIGFEIIAGVAVLLGFAFRFFSFLLLLLTLFFTFLTAYVYYYEVQGNPKVKECGCFGDCIKITNAETFWKDVILTVLVLILFSLRRYVRPLLPKYPNAALMVLAIFFAFGVQWWALEHNPYYDCMPYQVGTSIPEARKPKVGDGFYSSEYETVSVWKNLKTGEKKEINVKDFAQHENIWGDTVNWASDTTMVKLIREGNNDPLIKDFTLAGPDGTDYTESILQQPGYSFLLFLKNPDKAREDNMNKLKALFTQCQQNGVPAYVLSSGLPDQTERWKAKHQLPGAEFVSLDLTASKTAMRTDPGLMLIKDGVIQKKWSFRDYPTATKISPTVLELK